MARIAGPDADLSGDQADVLKHGGYQVDQRQTLPGRHMAGDVSNLASNDLAQTGYSRRAPTYSETLAQQAIARKQAEDAAERANKLTDRDTEWAHQAQVTQGTQTFTAGQNELSRAATVKAAAVRAANAGSGGIDYDAIADGIESGDMPPTINTRSHDGMRVQATLAKRGYNLSQAQTDWNATQRHVSTLNGPQQVRLTQSINALPEMLDTVDSLAAEWNAGRFTTLNHANLVAAKSGLYGPKAQSVATRLEAQIADVTSDLGNVYMGGNSPTDAALKLAQHSLSADWDERTLKDMVKLAKQNVNVRRNSIASTPVAGASGGNPYGAQAPAASAVTAPTRTRYDINGNVIK